MIVRIDDFDNRSANRNKCYILNRPKVNGETGAFRVGVIDTERGNLDISYGAVEEMAGLLGWKSPSWAAWSEKRYDQYLVLSQLEATDLRATIDEQDTPSVAMRNLCREFDLLEAKFKDLHAQFVETEAMNRDLMADVEEYQLLEGARAEAAEHLASLPDNGDDDDEEAGA